MFERGAFQLALCAMLVCGCVGSKKSEGGDKNTEPVETTPAAETTVAPESQPATEAPPEESSPEASTDADPMLGEMTAVSKLDYATLREDAYLAKLRETFAAKPNPSHQDILRFAIPAGLYIDGVEPSFVGSITDQSYGKLFVGKCNICDPVRGGFDAYSSSGVVPSGTGLSAPLAEAFTGEDYEARSKSLTYLVHRYTEMSWGLLEIEGEKREEYKSQLVAARKRGMGLKPHDMKNCPSCDGANDIDGML